VVVEIGEDRVDQFLDALEDSTAQTTLRELPEEALDEVEPRAAGRDEV
jgi:hypothetical protein